MLKNKKAIYILIPLNLLIWGFFAYRFYSAYTGFDEPVSAEKLPVFKTSEIKDSVAYQLKFGYKDPFLKESVGGRAFNANNTGSLQVVQQNKAQQAPAKVPPANPPKQLPDIKYLGLIKNTSSGVVTALISVGGQSRLIKQNEVVEGITFKLLTRDSLVGKLGKERIVVRK